MKVLKALMILLALVMVLVLSGCVTATYRADATSEDFKVTSFFKSVDGLYAEKGGGQFSLKVDQTHTQDPVANMLKIMNLLQTIQIGEGDKE